MEPWLAQLAEGSSHAAWDLFAERYRGLLLVTIRRLVQDPDDVMEVFSLVCQALAADDLARVRRFTDRHSLEDGFPTWLVVVVRNLTIDWIRKRDGRQEQSTPENLSSLQQQIYRAIFLEGQSHAEAYERIRSSSGQALGFREFLSNVRETYRRTQPPRKPGDPLRRAVPVTEQRDLAQPDPDPAETADTAQRIEQVLATLPPEVRLAVEFFVVEGRSASEIATLLGWPNAKAVYNRVYRALESLRAEFQRRRIGRQDLG